MLAFLPALLLLPSPARADVALDPPAGRVFTSHSLRIEGLPEHPDFVIVAFDGPPGGTISTHRAFGKDLSSQHVLARGGSTRGGYLSQPSLYLLSAEAFAAWNSTTSTEIEKQRTACLEHGEGCAHISRFEPSYTAPTGTVSCGVQLELTTETDAGGPDLLIDVYKVDTLDASTCKLDKTGQERLKEGQPVKAAGGCSVLAGSAASVLAGLGLLLGLGRRRS